MLVGADATGDPDGVGDGDAVLVGFGAAGVLLPLLVHAVTAARANSNTTPLGVRRVIPPLVIAGLTHDACLRLLRRGVASGFSARGAPSWGGMTELLTRPPLVASKREPGTDVATLWWRGCCAALWAVSVGVASLIVVVLVGWAADSRGASSAAEAVRGALLTWLLGHHVPVRFGVATLGIAPLGLTLLLGLVVARASAALARAQEVTSAGRAALVAAAVAVPYGVLTAFVAAAATSTAARPSPVAALFGGWLVGLAGAVWGALRGAGATGAGYELLPARLRAPIGAGAVGFAFVAAGGLLLVLVGLARHAGDAWRLAHLLGGGPVGLTLVAALDLLLLPNAVAAAASYLAGPGFAVGAGTSVSVASTHAGALPALPLLAAVPHRGASVPVLAVCVLVLLVAGVMVGRRAAVEDRTRWGRMGVAAAAAGVAGVLTAVFSALAGGSAGPGRMAVVGASPWQAGLAVAAELAVVAVVTAALHSWLFGRSAH
jgi:hypothetical protein